MEFDLSELEQLTADLSRAPGTAVRPLRAATMTAAGRIRDQMRADATGIAHAPHFPRSITAEERPGIGIVGAEIGPDKDLRQGALGNILYLGTSKNGPVLDMNGPLDREAPRFERAVADAVRDLL